MASLRKYLHLQQCLQFEGMEPVAWSEHEGMLASFQQPEILHILANMRDNRMSYFVHSFEGIVPSSCKTCSITALQFAMHRSGNLRVSF